MKNQSKPIRIIIYRVTGRQLFFTVPNGVCEQCDITVGTVRSVIKELRAESQVELIIRPWLNNLISCLFWRSWHPPIVTINGHRFSQGVVLKRSKLVNYLKEYFSETARS